MQPPFRHWNFKLCSVSSLTVIEYSSHKQRLWSDWAYAQAGLSLCWSNIPHCWKSYVAAQICPSMRKWYSLHIHKGIFSMWMLSRPLQLDVFGLSPRLLLYIVLRAVIVSSEPSMFAYKGVPNCHELAQILFLHMVQVLKRTVSAKWFFWVSPYECQFSTSDFFNHKSANHDCNRRQILRPLS